ncbi:MAG: histidine ammonia-lyase [Blastocatellia bacterium]
MPSPMTGSEGAVLLDGENLRLEQVLAVARDFRKAALAPQAKERMWESRRLVEQWVEQGKVMYGITTGFGSLQKVTIAPEQAEQLQEDIILSHAAGVGEPLPEEVVRAMMALRANALAKGYSGIRVEVVEALLEMLNKRICPIVPAKGSVGSSGDLAPLAHLTLVLLGKGEALYKGKRLSGGDAMKRAGIDVVKLKAKEGLALTNGTQFMSAIGVLALLDAEALAKTADLSGAMSLEAVQGRSDPFLEEVNQLRPFSGQLTCARNIRKLVKHSQLIDHPILMRRRTAGKTADQGYEESKLQDAYSLRCMPQVHGASREALAFVRHILEIEINSATDNPLIRADKERSYSAGNFHGQPVALAMDFLALALAELGNISERRIARLLDKDYNFGLPAYLIDDSGLNTGMMIAQYTAAALASENKTLIHPASGDSIPTSSNQEDHNSMGSIAARQAREVLENVQRIVAIELLCAAQAIGFRKREGQEPGVGTAAGYQLIRQHIGQRKSDKDGEMHLDIQKAIDLVRNGELLAAVSFALEAESLD